MQTTKENAIVNRKLAQFKQLLGNYMIKKENNVKWFIEKMDDINHKVIANNYLETNCAGLIGCTALHLALSARNQEAFDILLDYGADFTVKNSNSLTALHQIIISLDNIILKYRHEVSDTLVDLVLSAHLKNENFQNPVDNSGLSHFHIACAANNLEVVKGFINSGVSINDAVKTDSSYFAGFSPLHFAAKFCAFEVVDVLLSYNANVYLKDTKGLTPIHAALERKIEIISGTHCGESVKETNEKILKMLLNKEKNNSTLTIDSYGLSHFHVSCALQDSKLAEHFLQNHENINSIINKDSPSWPGYTALHFAALCNIDTVKLLMKRGADMIVKNAKGVTPFDLCIERYKPQDIYVILSLNPMWKNITLSDGKTKLSELVFAMRHPNQFKLFLKKLSNNFYICDSPLWPGCTPMHLAVIFTKTNVHESVAANLEILQILFKQCPSMLQHQDIHGHTPVHLAFRLKKKLVLILLMNFLQECTNLVDRVDEDGLAFVHIASATNEIVLLQRLLAMGSDVNAIYRGKSEFSPTINRGSTALHFAVINDNREAVEILINFGADVYAKDANDMTPIHLLSSYNTARATANILLSLPNLKDSIVSGTGLSHLHVASFHNNNEAVERLLEIGADINGVITVQTSANEESSKFKFVERFAGGTPLLIASQQHNKNIKDLLVERGADCFIKNADGTPWLYSLADSIFIFHRDWFVKALQERDDLMTRLKADTGMTTLHVACLLANIGDVKKNLIEGTDVNKQIRFESPIFRGYTALHILIRNKALNEELLRLFLKTNSDVTLKSSESKTVIHMAYDIFIQNRGNDSRRAEYCTYVNIMLEAQQDFNVNPTSVDGTSHFHIACSVCNVNVVEKFLKSGRVNINQPIDYFHDDEPGYSALHLVAGSEVRFNGASKQLHTLDLLLRHGADVHAEDNFGDTPLHDSARCNALDVFERLVRNGSDVNARNTHGHTPLHDYSKSNDEASVEGIKILLRFGCRFNSFGIVDGSGCIGQISNALSYEDMQSLFSAVMINFPQEMEIDSDGRTVIHNLVSTDSSKISALQYPELIEKISRAGYDVDDQDKSGKTALHMAAKFQNLNAISGLLMAGADINILDSYSKTAFASIFDSCMKCECDDDEDGDSDDNEDQQMCRHQKTIVTLANYINKLKIFELYVSKQNEDLAFEVCKKFESETALSENFFKELENAKTDRIGSCTLTLHSFLSENGAVAGFPRMLMETRDAVNHFFSPSEMPACREKFPELAGILLLQYRKARARPPLVESAESALKVCVGFRMPEICSDLILTFLKNSDLKSLITAAIGTEVAE